MVSLRDAVERLQQQPGSPKNSYNWWRSAANRYGQADFGNTRQLAEGSSTTLPISKIGNRWFIDTAAFEAALAEHAAAQAELSWISSEYKQHRLHVSSGETLYTSWGSYKVAGPFHIKNQKYALPWKDGAGAWVCNQCWNAASSEHNKDECHACRDWNGCGQDCTLSAVICANCGTRIDR